MDYEKAYNDALKRAKAMIEVASNPEEAEGYASTIFPELKESEEDKDEKIRKWLIKYFNKADFNGMLEYVNGIKAEDIFAWLEKQKIIDVLDEEERKFADDVDSYRKDMDEFYKKGYNAGREAEKQYWLEKQTEQKPTEVAESEDEKIRKAIVNAIHNYAYRLEEKIPTEWLTWLEKQKPTDVLPIFRVGDELCKKNSYHPFFVERIVDGYYCCNSQGEYFPIEEQTEWDLVEKKQEWTEEDERMFFSCCGAVYAADHYTSDDKQDIEDWLKTIKKRINKEI